MNNKSLFCGLLIVAVMFLGCKKEAPEAPAEEEQTQSMQPMTPVEQQATQTERNVVEAKKKSVKLETNMGDIVIEMNEDAAPGTVKNFLDYVESGFYDGVIFHRVIPGFMIQAGGFTAEMVRKEPGAPIKNEFKESNVRGTIAMAKLPGNPDSATCQFFINLVDNGVDLDDQNGGFTVFGKVTEGMDVADKIASVQTTTKMGMGDVPIEPVVIKSAKVVTE
jgi:peptidyl-prolyl cis-trans isomerase A (cyclophilin A)